MTEDRIVERLSEERCWEMLRTQSLGRIATRVGDVLDIFPVNYYADGSSILFRTAPGDKLLELTINENVTFQVDHFTEQLAWSVIAKGTAKTLDLQAELEAAEKLPLTSWIPTPKSVYVRITPRTLTGRWFIRGPEIEQF